MNFYVIAYDIPNDRRRQKIADLLEGYGKRVQYSVFECYLSRSKLKELQTKLLKTFKLEEDSIRFYFLSSSSLHQVQVWGNPGLTAPPSSTII